jgi:hypothetical protein
VGVIWGFVVVLHSPNNPPIELVYLAPLFISGGACAIAIACIDTLGKTKFYVYGVGAASAYAMTVVFTIFFFVYFTFTCPGDATTLQPFLCTSGIPYNTVYAAFVFQILTCGLSFIAFLLALVVLFTMPPPTIAEIKEELRIEIIKQQAHIPANLNQLYQPVLNQLTQRLPGSSVIVPMPPAPPEMIVPAATMQAYGSFQQPAQYPSIPAYQSMPMQTSQSNVIPMATNY